METKTIILCVVGSILLVCILMAALYKPSLGYSSSGCYDCNDETTGKYCQISGCQGIGCDKCGLFPPCNRKHNLSCS